MGRVLGVRGCRKSFSLTPEKKGPQTVQTHPTPSRRCQCTGSTNRPTGRATPCTCPNHGHLSNTGASIPGLPHLTAPQCLGRYICSMSLPTPPLPRNFRLSTKQGQHVRFPNMAHPWPSPLSFNVPATCVPSSIPPLASVTLHKPSVHTLSPEIWIGCSVSREWALGVTRSSLDDGCSLIGHETSLTALCYKWGNNLNVFMKYQD